MSYNSYNQYSPYWQQSAGQTTPQSSAQNSAQSRTSYQPLSAYQSNQQIAQSSISQSAESSSGTSYGSQGYGNVNVNGAGSGRPHSSYANVDDRASLDGATALGNLAYASSLGRDGSAQSMNNYNRNNSNYGTASPYGTSAGKYAREDTNTRAQQSTASPSFDHSSNNKAYQTPNTGSNTQAQSQYPSSRSPSEQHRTNQYSQPPRPTNGQAFQQPRSTVDSRAAPASTTTYTQSIANQSQGRNDGRDVRSSPQTRVQTPQQPINRPPSSQTSRPSLEHTQKPQARQGTRETAVNLTGNSATKTKAAAQRSTDTTAAKRNNKAVQSPVADDNQQASKPTTPVEPQYTTVDPSQVFNHAEYSRRQAAAAAEVAAAKKAAEEVEIARKASMLPKPPQVNETTAAPAPGPEPDSTTKEQIEQEMKQMIEKMRDYKARDPSLFTQIWEQVKKSQPPQRPPSQAVQGSATSPVVLNGQLPSPSLIQSQLPSESDLLASGEFPPNFDRGRFPAQRRRRGGATKTSPGRKLSTPNNHSKQIPPQTQNDEDQKPSLPPELAIPAPKVDQIFPDPRNQSMEEATKQFNQNSQSTIARGQQAAGSSEKPPASSTAPAQSVQAQSAPPLKPGGTYWPENKKEALAEAARHALTSTAPNLGKTITTHEIHELLDQNPSYIQMCEILEYRGFFIDRVQFARTLLKAVPDLGSASNQANAASTSSVSANNATPTTAAPTVSNNESTKANSTKSTAGAFGVPNAPRALPHPAPPVTASQAPNAYVGPYAHPSPSTENAGRGKLVLGPRQDYYRFVDPAQWVKTPHPHPGGSMQGWHEPPQNPNLVHQQSGPNGVQTIEQNGMQYPNDIISQPTKQEIARKRTFGEIVDLTTLSDEEEIERRGSRPRIDYRGAPGPSQSVNNMYDPFALPQQNNGTTMPKPKPFKYKYSGRDALLQSYDIVKPMNPRRNALRRSMYNPKTIARDFLLAIGKHPTLAPLNAHLDVLRDRFKAVDNESDLSTFRWDLVDPGGAAHMRSTDTDDEEAVPPKHTENRSRPAPMAVLINNGGVAKKDQTLHHKAEPNGKTEMKFGEQPVGPAPARQSPKSQPYAQDSSKTSGTGPSANFLRFAYTSPYAAQTNSPVPNATSTTPNASDSSTPGSTPKRKGRPLGSKNKQVRPDKGLPKKPKILSTDETPSTAQARLQDDEALKKTPVLGTPSLQKPTTLVPTRPHINTTTPSRPSGLRNSISASTPIDGIAIVIPSRSPSAVSTPQASTKKGRTTIAEYLSHRSPSPGPAYTIYRCHWENCPAELHNFETLKKHVKKHRRATDGVYPCLWTDFDSSNPISNDPQGEERDHKRLRFKTEEEWIAHVESSHLKTEMAFLARGPSRNGSVIAKSDYSES